MIDRSYELQTVGDDERPPREPVSVNPPTKTFDSASRIFDRVIGSSPKMRGVLQRVRRIAPTDLAVLIEGETGTGKEVIARAIHEASKRADARFVVLDCSAVPSSLLESQLFGQERGAYTGAVGRPGLLEDANGGTLFVDELGELPLDLQQKLLRALEPGHGEYRRLGSSRTQRTDVRVIAATNRSLRREIAAGRFRKDVYYRLAGVTIHLPPLRERPEDIPALVDYFIRRSQPVLDRTALPDGMLDEFLRHDWPGNVRELEATVRRVLVLSEWPEFEFGAAPASHWRSLRRSTPRRLAQVLETFEAWAADPSPHLRADWLPLEAARIAVQQAFEHDYLDLLHRSSGGNRARAAKHARVTRQAIQKLVRKHGLDWNPGSDERE